MIRDQNSNNKGPFIYKVTGGPGEFMGVTTKISVFFLWGGGRNKNSES